MGYRAKIVGKEKLMKRLRVFVPDAEKEMTVAKRTGMQEVAELIASRAPKKTGDLALSYTADLVKNNPTKNVYGLKKINDDTAVGIYGKFYWRFQEFGTAGHSVAKGAVKKSGKLQDVGPWIPDTTPQPHVYPTWRANKKTVKKKVRVALNKAVKKSNAGRKTG